MTGTLEINKTTRYDIIKKWASKPHIQKDARINFLITEILEENLPYDVLADRKMEAVIISEMILRK